MILLDEIIGLVPDLERRLAGGLEVLEANSGNGTVLHSLAARFPTSLFEGIDRSREALATAVTATSARGLKNIRHRKVDSQQCWPVQEFDLVLALEAIPPLADSLPLVQSLAGALRPGGSLLLRVPESDAPVLTSEGGWLELLTRAGLVEVEAARLASDGLSLYLAART